jgi:hypothetical protein
MEVRMRIPEQHFRKRLQLAHAGLPTADRLYCQRIRRY